MIRLDRVTMRYPIPKRCREYLFGPFKRTEQYLALRELSLQVARGECLGVLGPNGAGKTTLLRLIGGLLYPTEGRIRVGGIDTQADNLAARRKVAFVLNEDRSFFWRLTGWQNLEFFGALDNIAQADLRHKGGQLLDLVGLNGSAYKRVSDYSSGMRQRLAIARALLSEPDVLLLDEPTKSLDPLATHELRNSIRSNLSAGQGKTLILVTHDLDEVRELCHRVCLVVAGRLVAVDDVDAVARRRGGLKAFYQEGAVSLE